MSIKDVLIHMMLLEMPIVEAEKHINEYVRKEVRKAELRVKLDCGTFCELNNKLWEQELKELEDNGGVK